METFLEIARNRYSCRKYDQKSVEQEKLELILEAGRVAPSAVNFQPWHIFVIQDPNELQKLQGMYHREWFRTAPCAMVICGDHSKSWKRKEDAKDHCDIDVAIATDHMTLQATELGLATCWICNFEVAKTRELLGLEEHLEPLVLLPLGYPLDECNPDRHREKRKSLREVVTYGLQGSN